MAYTLKSKLGEGGNAIVYRAVDKQSNERVAVKLFTNPSHHAAAISEYQLTRELNHPNIARMHGLFQSQNNDVMLVQELADAGDLFQRVFEGDDGDNDAAFTNNNNSRREAFTRATMLQIIDGLMYLHDNGIVHGDIKAENVCLHSDGRVMLVDFGMAKRVGQSTTCCGTIPYLSPEQLSSKGDYTARPAHDVWSVGVLLFGMLTKRFPWEMAHRSDDDYVSFCMGSLTRTQPWTDLSYDMVDLLESVFTSPEDRITLPVLRERLQSMEAYYRTIVYNYSSDDDEMPSLGSSTDTLTTVSLNASLTHYCPRSRNCFALSKHTSL